MDAKRGPILFRCDGTAETGYEPLYQCLSLAAAMQRRRRGTHFLSYLDPLNIAQTIHRQNNEWVPAEQMLGSPNDLAATLKEIRKREPSAVVLCGQGYDEEYMNAVRGTGAMVIVIDSTAKLNYQADLVVNPFLAPASRMFEFSHGAQLLHGRKYALVRAVFRRQRTIRAIEQPAPYRAMLCMGDDDVDQSFNLSQQLLDVPKVDKISIVCRSHHVRFDDLETLASKSGKRIEIVTEVKELMPRLVRAHFVITSGDTWSFELCCVGIPQLTIPRTAMQLAHAKKMDDIGVATLVGTDDNVTFEKLAEAVEPVLSDPMERLGMSRCGRNLIDGRGGDRIVDGMEILLRTPGLAQSMRRAA